MKPKMICKIILDLVMTILLLLLMAKQITGASAHEWLGAGMFVLWIVHHILNFRWHRQWFKGRMTPFRILQAAVNFLLLIAMLGTMVSAVILSREVFAFLPIAGGIALARPMHIFCAFWGFTLMALHLGMHWSMILGMARKAAGGEASPKMQKLLRILGGAAAVYGLYAFLKNRIWSYLFLTLSFVYFDFEQPVVLFFLEYLGMMASFVFLAHYGTRKLKG